MPDNELDNVTVYGKNRIFPLKRITDRAPIYNTPQMKSVTSIPPFKKDATSSTTGTRKNVFSKFGDIVPYLSNIANSFKKVPLPDAPGVISPVAARQVNFGAQRAEADRQRIGMDRNLQQNLGENTASAAMSGNLAGVIRAKNSIAEAEANTNAQLGQQAASQNAQIDAQNVGLQNQWKRDLVEGQVAGQREQSANLSNAADKYIMQQNEQGKADLDRERWQAYQPLWKNSGVAERAFGDESEYATWLKQNQPDAYEQQYGNKLKMGGSMRKKVFTPNKQS